jgi:hypothetical protein
MEKMMAAWRFSVEPVARDLHRLFVDHRRVNLRPRGHTGSVDARLDLRPISSS